MLLPRKKQQDTYTKEDIIALPRMGIFTSEVVTSFLNLCAEEGREFFVGLHNQCFMTDNSTLTNQKTINGITRISMKSQEAWITCLRLILKTCQSEDNTSIMAIIRLKQSSLANVLYEQVCRKYQQYLIVQANDNKNKLRYMFNEDELELITLEQFYILFICNLTSHEIIVKEGFLKSSFSEWLLVCWSIIKKIMDDVLTRYLIQVPIPVAPVSQVPMFQQQQQQQQPSFMVRRPGTSMSLPSGPTSIAPSYAPSQYAPFPSVPYPIYNPGSTHHPGQGQALAPYPTLGFGQQQQQQPSPRQILQQGQGSIHQPSIPYDVRIAQEQHRISASQGSQLQQQQPIQAATQVPEGIAPNVPSSSSDLAGLQSVPIVHGSTSVSGIPPIQQLPSTTTTTTTTSIGGSVAPISTEPANQVAAEVPAVLIIPASGKGKTNTKANTNTSTITLGA
jgi:hypothetical protein